MDQTESLYDNVDQNPCYTSSLKEPDNSKAANYSYYEVSPDQKAQEWSKELNTLSSESTTKTTSTAKGRERVLLIIVLCIAVASIIVSVVALVLSLWSALAPSTASQGTTGSLEQNQTFVTPEQLSLIMEQMFAKMDETFNQFNETLTTLEQFDQTLNLNFSSFNDHFLAVRNNISTIENTVQNQESLLTACCPAFRQVPECGPGNWLRVTYLNMSDSSQQCPSAWREYTSPVRSCGRPVTSSGSCPSTLFQTFGFTFRRVCGRAIGYQYGSPDAYAISDIPNPPAITSPSDNYVDGVSVTHGNASRTHIWTFAGGASRSTNDRFTCPCYSEISTGSPSFVGNDYFCDSGSPGGSDIGFLNQTLWDGIGCTGDTCCTFNSPPWFRVELSSSTSDDIEVRICGDEDTDNEDTPVELLEIYVQ